MFRLVRHQPIKKNNRIDLRFCKDANGELYMLTKADGKIYKIVSLKN
jgi:hypothetical protein